MRIIPRSIVVGLLAMGALMLGISPSARADTFFYDITAANVPFPGPYVQVEVDLVNPTTADITFTSLVQSGNIYLMHSNGAAGVNVNASSFSVSNITASNSAAGFTPSVSLGSPGNEDGFGNFNLTINDADGFMDAASTISFTVTNTSGGTWAGAALVLGANAAAAQIGATPFPANASSGAFISPTGFAGGAVPAPPRGGSPEPSSLILFGFGVLALAFVMRRHLLPSEDSEDNRLAA